MSRSVLRAGGGCALALAATLALAGCGTPPWATQATTEPASSPAPTRTQSAAPQPVPNDLSSGSTERQLQAGAIAANVNYWSTLSMDRWTGGALKPVSLSMSATVVPDDGKRVYLQRATMIAVPGNASGALNTLEPQVDQATVTPGYPLLSPQPQSYSQTFNVGEVPAEATYVTLQFSYEYLMQTTPTSNEYAKQTATDTLTVAIAGAAQ